MRTKKRSGSRAVDIDQLILAALTEGPLSTKQLAAELGLARGTIYNHCRGLDGKRLLASKLAPTRGPMYCLDEQKAVDRTQYDNCVAEEHDLRPIDLDERVWSLP